jgi:putative acetyltransferase
MALSPAEETAALDLWERAWSATFPQIDFAARRDWIARRLAEGRARGDSIVGVFGEGRLAGFLTLELLPRAGCGHVDQIAVDPAAWGSGAGRLLIDAAKARCPRELTLSVNADNERARRFYAQAGFEIAGVGHNPASGLPTLDLRWSPQA